jgi:deazaflavin-dependent oxidoreductase (nitroreductase family)
MYAGGRPGPRAKRLNALWARVGRLGLGGDRLVTLEVIGRTSGRPISVPLMPARVDGVLYLGSMLGEGANWVRNVRAAGGHAVLHHGRRHEQVVLAEVPVDRRVPLIKAFLDSAPGARPHVPVDREAPPDEIAAVADQIPIFRVEPRA